MSLETTKSGEMFYEQGLGNFTPPTRGAIGLPGLGMVASSKLKAFGLVDAAAVFGLYLAFGRDGEVFLEYLEGPVGVKFLGNAYADGAAMKRALVDTLEAKWNKLKEY